MISAPGAILRALDPLLIIILRHALQDIDVWLRIESCKIELRTLVVDQGTFDFMHLRPILLWT